MSYAHNFDQFRFLAIILVSVLGLLRAAFLATGLYSRKSLWNRGDWLLFGLLAVIGLQTFVICPFRVTSRSMQPTLDIGDIVLGLRTGGDVVPGEIVLFEMNKSMLVKRVLAGPGSVVEFKDGCGWVDGALVSKGGDPNYRRRAETVPLGHFFMVGDNSRNSQDSRFHGPISGKLIWGRVACKVWPFREMRIL